MQGDPSCSDRCLVLEARAAETALMAERMRALGAWGAYATLSNLAKSRQQRAERMRRVGEAVLVAG